MNKEQDFTVTFAVVVSAKNIDIAKEKAINCLYRRKSRERAFTEIYEHSTGKGYY